MSVPDEVFSPEEIEALRKWAGEEVREQTLGVKPIQEGVQAVEVPVAPARVPAPPQPAVEEVLTLEDAEKKPVPPPLEEVAIPYTWNGKHKRWRCKDCKFDDKEKGIVETHHYYKHVMEVHRTAKGETVLRKKRPVKAVLYNADNKLITEVEN